MGLFKGYVRRDKKPSSISPQSSCLMPKMTHDARLQEEREHSAKVVPPVLPEGCEHGEILPWGHIHLTPKKLKEKTNVNSDGERYNIP